MCKLAPLTYDLLLVVHHGDTMDLVLQHEHCGICIDQTIHVSMKAIEVDALILDNQQASKILEWNVPETVFSADKVMAGELMTSFTFVVICCHTKNSSQ